MNSQRGLLMTIQKVKKEIVMPIKYQGITTHNLKGIDFSITEDSIVVLKGVSGCGKSSLAIDTIYQISEDELAQMMNRPRRSSLYSIEEYSGILPGICLRQENYNINPRSTIGTYFGMNLYVQNIFSYVGSISREMLRFNNPDVACEKCHGLGTILVPSLNDIIDIFVPLSERAFKIWNGTDSDFYYKLFDAFCRDNGISTSLPFTELSEDQKNKLLYGASDKKYSIQFISGRIKHSRTKKYTGCIDFLNDILAKKELTISMRRFFVDEPCPSCNGGRFSHEIDKYLLFGKTIAEIYLTEFDVLSLFIKKNLKKTNDPYLLRQFKPIVTFLDSAINAKLGYLNLNRSIPSLSGGELQRLCMAKACIGQFNRFLYVMDEPTSALHPSEWSMMAEMLQNIRNRHNTILLIEHSHAFDKMADKVVFLGPGAGRDGGQIIPSANEKVHDALPYSFIKSSFHAHITVASYNNVKIEDADIPTKSLIGICGVSGSGKTSFAKKILPQYIPNATYINQEPLRGNSYSIVATALDILKDIALFFSVVTKRDVKLFNYCNDGPGCCTTCDGVGRVVEKSIHWVSENECPDCKGMRFSKRALSAQWHGYNIYDFLNLSIAQIQTLLATEKNISKKLKTASDVGLGYLRLFQRTDTLSGGEAQRIKLAANISKFKKPRTFILDEPFRGVDLQNEKKIIQLLIALVKAGNTVYVVEHDPFVLAHCSYLLEFGPGSGTSGGKIIFNGTRSSIAKCKQSIIAQYLPTEIERII